TSNMRAPVRSSRSARDGRWARGTTRVCPGVTGSMSRKATTVSSEWTTVAGASPAAIRQKTQSGSLLMGPVGERPPGRGRALGCLASGTGGSDLLLVGLLGRRLRALLARGRGSVLGLLLGGLGRAAALPERGGEESGGLGGVDGVGRVDLLLGLRGLRLGVGLGSLVRGGLRLGLGGGGLVRGLRRLAGAFARRLDDGLGELALAHGAGDLGGGLGSAGVARCVDGLGHGRGVGGPCGRALVGGALGGVGRLGLLLALGVGEAELGEEVGVDVTELGGRLGARLGGHVAVVVVDVGGAATA